MNTNAWTRYEELLKLRPEEFKDSGPIHIVTDHEIIKKYESETGTVIGVRYESAFSILLVDLVWEKEGEYFPYERIIPCVSQGAVICVPKINDKYIILKQFRHALRDYQYSFPRGFAEKGLSGEENALKELSEEIGGVVKKFQKLGCVVADSGINNALVEIWLCHLTSYNPHIKTEGIVEISEVTYEQLNSMILNNQINDGYTLSAVSFISADKNI